MQSCIQFSGSVVVVVLILSMAVNAGGQLQRGLCKEGCSELPEGRNCEVEHMDVPTTEDLENLDTNRPNQLTSCPSCKDSDCLATNSTSPKLSIELQHYSLTRFGIVVTWELPEDVMEFEDVNLILTDSQSKTCHDLPNPGSDYHAQCTFLSPDEQPYNFTYLYRHQTKPKIIVKQTLYVKFTAYFKNGCSTTTTEMVTVPESCHTLHPGNCQLCGEKNSNDFPVARNVTVNPCLHVNESMWEVFISWETYMSNRPTKPYLCENCSYYLNISEGTEITQLKVVGGRTNVTLKNLTTQQSYSVRVQPYDCHCEPRSQNVSFSLGALDPTPSSRLNSVTSTENSTRELCPTTSSQLNPVTSIKMVENSTPESLLLSTTRKSQNPMASIKTVLSSTPSPPPTNTDGTVPYMAIYIPVGFMIVMVVTIAVLVGIMRRTIICRPENKITDDFISDSENGVKDSYEEASLEDYTSQPKQASDGPTSPNPSHVQTRGESFSLYPMASSGAAKSDKEAAELMTDHSAGGAAVKSVYEGASLDVCDHYTCTQTFTPQYTALLVYSPLTPEDQLVPIHRLIRKLCDPHGITIYSPPFESGRNVLVEWIPETASKCDAVICIYNEQFHNEWYPVDCKRPQNGSDPCIHILKTIIHGRIHVRKDLSKYAVVVMPDSSIQNIPEFINNCKYYQFESKSCVEDIVRFITKIPDYQDPCKRTD